MPGPPSALTRSCAVLKFLDLAARLIDQKSSGKQDNEQSTELKHEARRLEEAPFGDSVSDQTNRESVQAKQTESESVLQKTYEKCKVLSNKVVSSLEHDGGGKVDAKGKDGLSKLGKEVDSLKAACSSQLLKLLNDRQAIPIKRLDQLRSRDATMDAHVSGRFVALRQELLAALDMKRTSSKSDRPAWMVLDEEIREAQHVKIAQEILLSLRFDGMQSRKHTIPGTHGDTYEWIFSAPRSVLRQRGLKANFPDWLSEESGIFWITGHPGSGKSTLMKFVDNHATTRAKLQDWSSGYKLVKASHYFWVNGSSLQKSQAGLLRALCFDILRQCPGLLPLLCEDRWNAGLAQEEIQKDWTITELEKVLNHLKTSELKVNREPVRFCFFIDGLDEYSGDYDELLNNLRELAGSPHIKICAASRPWKLFDEALGQDSTRMLTMQDVTTDDISTYVRDVLEEDKQYRSLSKTNGGNIELIDTVIERANGVFLWVDLVIRQLQRDLEQNESMGELRTRIDQFPSDLDDYFRHMLDTVDIFQQRETAQVFRVCIRARQPLPLLAFSILDPDNPISVRLDSNGSVSQEEVDKLSEKMRYQIVLRGPDLLEVVRTGKFEYVTFTHRTVRDFLTHNNMDTLFAGRAGNDFKTGEEFDPLVTLCRMSILGIRRANLITDSANEKPLQCSLIDDTLDYAADMELAQSRTPAAELDDLDEILAADKDLVARLDTNRINPLLPLAIRQNLRSYIKNRTENGGGGLQLVTSYPDRPLLSYALPVFRLRSSTPAEFHPEMVNALLCHGSDPNTISWLRDEEANLTRKGTIWSLYLRTLYSLYKRPKTRPQGSLPLVTTEALIEAGAQYVPACLTEDGNKGEREILESVFGKFEAARLLSLRAQATQPVKSARTGSETATRPVWAKANSKLRRLSLSGSAVGS